MNIVPDAASLSALAGAALSLLFSYVPGFSGWYTALDSIRKRLVMLGLLAVVAMVSFAIAYQGWSLAPDMDSSTCGRSSAVALLQAFLAAVVANQSIHRLSPRRKT